MRESTRHGGDGLIIIGIDFGHDGKGFGNIVL